MTDPFADYTRPGVARGMHMLGGMAVIIDPNIPKEHIGTRIEPRPPVVRWFLRRVPKRWRPRWYRVGSLMEQEQFMQAAGKLFCTPAGYQVLKMLSARKVRHDR